MEKIDTDDCAPLKGGRRKGGLIADFLKESGGLYFIYELSVEYFVCCTATLGAVLGEGLEGELEFIFSYQR